MSCGGLVRAGAEFCARCGFRVVAGLPTATVGDGKGAARRCSSCGYDLTGLKKPVCPECGTSFSRKDFRRLDREHSDSVAREEWIKPAVMLGAGWAIMLLHALIAGGLAGAGTYLLHFAVAFPAGVGAYTLCCIAGIGFGAPFWLTVWRLAGTSALLDAATLASGVIPNPYISWGLPALVAVVIFEQVFDLDWPEAAAAGFLTYAARRAAVMALTGELSVLF